LLTCPSDFYGDSESRECKMKEECNILGKYVYEKLCIPDCTIPSNPVKPYYHNGGCLSECPDGFQGHEGKGLCLSTCPVSYYAYIPDKICINKQRCNDQHMFVYNQDCIEDCQITKNPAKIYYYQGECLAECPNSLYVL
jgi:hypothetical protein